VAGVIARIIAAKKEVRISSNLIQQKSVYITPRMAGEGQLNQDSDRRVLAGWNLSSPIPARESRVPLRSVVSVGYRVASYQSKFTERHLLQTDSEPLSQQWVH
jgi:hypothetical protein